MNSAPVPEPSLRAAMLPPCNSTRLHQGEAESEPACAFLPVAAALPERVEHPRQQFGDDPPAVVPAPAG